MKTIHIRFLAAALAVVFGTVMAHAQSTDATSTTPTPAPQHYAMHRHGFRHAGYRSGFFAGYLNLTDAQKTQMKSIMQKERETMKPLMQQMGQTRQQLHQFEEGNYDEAKVRTLAAQQSQAQVELTVERTKLHNELFQVLTPEQQAKMKEVEARRAERMQQRRAQQQAAPAPAQEQ